jgi:hypothetical protein
MRQNLVVIAGLDPAIQPLRNATMRGYCFWPRKTWHALPRRHETPAAPHLGISGSASV